MNFLLSLIVAFVLLIGTPICISYFIYRWLSKKDYHPLYRLFALIPIVVIGYFVYVAIYPDDDFYKTDFKEVTNMDFPQNGKIIYKTASFPDQFGDYTSSFLVEFDEEFINKLEIILKNNNFIKKENELNSNELNYIENRKGNINYSVQYIKDDEIGKYYSIGFLNDKKSVIVTRASW